MKIMNEEISDIIAQHLSKLPFLTKVAGCVQELTIDLKGKKPKKIPIANLIYTSSTEYSDRINLDPNAMIETKHCKENEINKDLIPNSKEIGIAYFEDLGSRRLNGNSRMDNYEGTLKLVVWLNMKKIGDYNISQLQNSVISHLPKNISNNLTVKAGFLNVNKILPKRPSPFEKYSYEESEKQYLIFPFNYFAIELRYNARIVNKCSTNILLNPSEC